MTTAWVNARTYDAEKVLSTTATPLHASVRELPCTRGVYGRVWGEREIHISEEKEERERERESGMYTAHLLLPFSPSFGVVMESGWRE